MTNTWELGNSEREQSLGVVERPQIGGLGGKSPKRQFEASSLSHSKADCTTLHNNPCKIPFPAMLANFCQKG